MHWPSDWPLGGRCLRGRHRLVLRHAPWYLQSSCPDLWNIAGWLDWLRAGSDWGATVGAGASESFEGVAASIAGAVGGVLGGAAGGAYAGAVAGPVGVVAAVGGQLLGTHAAPAAVGAGYSWVLSVPLKMHGAHTVLSTTTAAAHKALIAKLLYCQPAMASACMAAQRGIAAMRMRGRGGSSV